MFPKVSNQVDFVHQEQKVLAFWDEVDAFGELRRRIAGGEPWSFIDGPITANNPMGVHHAWGRTYKDCFHRYFAMNGRDIRYQPGFDCQGLWVELEVEKELGIKSKRDIVEYGLARFTETCKARVRKYARIQAEQSKRLGFWMDWDRAYYTMSDANNYTIWRFLAECHRRGYLYKGTDVMPWSGRAGTAYSDMEVKEGRRLTTHTSVFVRLPLRGRAKEYLLVWTTTPWTLTGNVGVAVSGELEYAKIQSKRDGAVYYVAKANLEHKRLEKEFKEGFAPFGEWPKSVPKLKTLDQLFKEQGGYEVLEVLPGSALVGWTYDGPFDELPAQQRRGGFASPLEILPKDQHDWPAAREAHRVFDAGRDSRGEPYVVAGEGTGLVHCAPGSGDVDHLWGRAHGLVSIAPLDEDGKFVAGFGFLEGMDPTRPETVEAILGSLRAKGLLFASETYPHVYPHCWRTKDELVYRLVDEWYVSMDWRERIQELAREVRWLPEEMHGEERELDWLATMRDWMISKKRFWGLALPIWECSSCGHFDVIGGREELRERALEGWEEFEREGHSPHRPYVDRIRIRCAKCGAPASRIQDVGNPWLDAGIVAYSTTGFLEDLEEWRRWVPADFVTECFPGQFRNWFYAMLAMSTMMELARTEESPGEKPHAPFRNLLGHALVMDEHGREMHKSDGTAIWFEEAAEQIGVDTMRWMYCAQPPIQNLKFGLRHPSERVEIVRYDGTVLRETIDGAPLCKVSSTPADEARRKVLIPLWNSYSFFCNYARLEDFVPGGEEVPLAERADLDRWLLSELELTTRAVRASFESYQVDGACRAIERLLDGLSRWYIRRSRRRFWRGEGASAAERRDSLGAYQTLYEALETLIRIAAPILPFTTEEIYQGLVRSHDTKAPVSVHHREFPRVREERIDLELAADMEAAGRVASLARSVREKHKVGIRQPLRELVVVPRDEREAAALDRTREHVLEELNVKRLSIELAPEYVHWELKPRFDLLGKRLGKQMKLVKPALDRLDARRALADLATKERVLIELEGEEVALSSAEVQALPQVTDERPHAFEGGTVVLLDLELDRELEIEGLARELVRKLQDLRKSQGLELEQRVRLLVHTKDQDLREVLQRHRETISAELLALELREEPQPPPASTAVDVRDGKLLHARLEPL